MNVSKNMWIIHNDFLILEDKWAIWFSPEPGNNMVSSIKFDSRRVKDYQIWFQLSEKQPDKTDHRSVFCLSVCLKLQLMISVWTSIPQKQCESFGMADDAIIAILDAPICKKITCFWAVYMSPPFFKTIINLLMYFELVFCRTD